MAIPETKHVVPDDTFLAYLVTNGIDMALINHKLLDRAMLVGRRYQFDLRLELNL